jgi:hypothetical protein
MEEEHTGLELEAITTRLKSEFAPPSTALPEAMQTLLAKLETDTR